MKKSLTFNFIFFLVNSTTAQTTQLKGVTFGIGMGWSYLNKAPNEYFLTTDTAHKLQIQNLSKSSIVVSSVISIKLGHLSQQTQEKTSDGSKKTILVNSNRITNIPQSNANEFRASNTQVNARNETPTNQPARFIDRLSVNVALNLAEISSNDISFNKSIDGGIGVGVFINDFTQLGIFYDMIRIRQLRSYIADNYEGKSIPNGTEKYNALDEKNNNLYYSKYFSGISVKAIFSFGNK